MADTLIDTSGPAPSHAPSLPYGRARGRPCGPSSSCLFLLSASWGPPSPPRGPPGVGEVLGGGLEWLPLVCYPARLSCKATL
jgi:hypothetical protein